MTIGPFKDDFRWLSNFWISPVFIAGNTYLTTEHFYQANKCENQNEFAEIIELETPGQAKRAGTKVTIRHDWDNIKLSIMTIASFSKFAQNLELAEKLIETGEEELVELNHWHDNFWGVCTCDNCENITGENNLGKILMNVRAHLQERSNGALFI